MKLLYIFLAIVTGVLIYSCDKEKVPVDDKEKTPVKFELGIEKSFKINGKYQSDDYSLKFKLTEINDSRCPTDVVCVWAGKADVKIEVESPVAGSIVLSTINNNYNNSIDTIGNYSFELIDVLPYPISTQNTELEDYDVKLKVKKLEL